MCKQGRMDSWRDGEKSGVGEERVALKKIRWFAQTGAPDGSSGGWCVEITRIL